MLGHSYIYIHTNRKAQNAVQHTHPLSAHVQMLQGPHREQTGMQFSQFRESNVSQIGTTVHPFIKQGLFQKPPV